MPIKRDFQGYFSQIAHAGNAGTTEKKSYKVENAFTPVFKDGTYEVVMRFLPSHPDEISPFIENRNHMFQLKNGTWFGCDCLSKFGKPCPICDYNRAMWKKYSKEEAKNHTLGKFRPNYVSNVLIVRNDNAPETEGKIFRFEYKSLVMGLISKAMTDHEDPEEGIIKGFNPFDWKNGANFIFKGVQAGKFTKNDGSCFGAQKPINRWDRTTKKFVPLTDEEIDAIEAQLYTLADCEHKESDVRDYNGILESYLKKNGSPLGADEGLTFGAGVAVAAAPSTAATTSSIPDDASFTPNTESVDQNVTDSDDFFSKLSNM